mmetsp:Transcript_47258/g.143675  ORF Transcript_47258/g.143675 Transcript_47258/m.143675 type:complete len:222 (+) Transcript_47258:1153-1818(+)
MRRYALRPWQSNNGTRKRNWEIVTSLACIAWLPSLPRMPTPTWADWIIATSLAPSPMARVMPRPFSFLTISTSLRFWFGDRRQHTHERLAIAASYNLVFADSVCKAAATKVPSITRPPVSADCRVVMAASSNSNACSGPVHSVKYARTMSSVNKRHDRTISMAVSVLSPVNTQKRMPAALINSMASGTPCCNLSSRAVMPTNVRPDSSSAAHASIVSCLPS